MRLLTPRLLLREFEPDDWLAMLRYHQDQRYQASYEPRQESEAEARAFVRMFMRWAAEAPRRRYQLAVTLRSNRSLIGNCGLRIRRLLDYGSPEASFEADVGYEIDAEYWNQGYASEAVAALVDYGFERLGLHRVWAYCLAENAASRRVLEKLGMRREGLLRQQEYMRGRWWDTLLYGMLESEWRQRGQS